MLSSLATGVTTVLGLIVAGGKAAQLAAVAGVVWLQAAVGLGDRLNLAANVFGGSLLIYVALRAGRSKVKDNTIRDLQDALEAKEARVRELRDEKEESEQQKRQIEQAARHCKEEAVSWQSKYEELERYTAEHAVRHFEEALAKHSVTVVGNHQKLLDQGASTAHVLERVAETLDRMAVKLDR